MKTLGYDQPLYVLPFDYRGSFVTCSFFMKQSTSKQQRNP
jgi:hypothetical protein